MGKAGPVPDPDRIEQEAGVAVDIRIDPEKFREACALETAELMRRMDGQEREIEAEQNSDANPPPAA